MNNTANFDKFKKTKIKILRKDGAFRIINAIGAWNISSASELGRDLERNNFLTVEILN